MQSELREVYYERSFGTAPSYSHIATTDFGFYGDWINGRHDHFAEQPADGSRSSG